MRVTICEDKHDMGYQAAKLGITIIKEAIEKKGHAVIAVATGLSQFSLYEHLAKADIDWSKVEAFGLAEYVDLPDTHPSSFRYYLNNRFVQKVTHLGAFHQINGDAENLEEEVKRLNALIKRKKKWMYHSLALGKTDILGSMILLQILKQTNHILW